MIRNIDLYVQIPGLSRTSTKIPGLSRPGIQILKFQDFPRTCTNPAFPIQMTEQVYDNNMSKNSQMNNHLGT